MACRTISTKSKSKSITSAAKSTRHLRRTQRKSSTKSHLLPSTARPTTHSTKPHPIRKPGQQGPAPPPPKSLSIPQRASILAHLHIALNWTALSSPLPSASSSQSFEHNELLQLKPGFHPLPEWLRPTLLGLLGEPASPICPIQRIPTSNRKPAQRRDRKVRFAKGRSDTPSSTYTSSSPSPPASSTSSSKKDAAEVESLLFDHCAQQVPVETMRELLPSLLVQLPLPEFAALLREVELVLPHLKEEREAVCERDREEGRGMYELDLDEWPDSLVDDVWGVVEPVVRRRLEVEWEVLLLALERQQQVEEERKVGWGRYELRSRTT